MTGRQQFELVYFAVAIVVVVVLSWQARRGGGWGWAFPAIFLLPAGQAAYRTLSSLHVLAPSSAASGPQAPALVDRFASTLFFVLLIYAFLRPLLPRYRGTLALLLGNNLVVLGGLTAVVWYDYGLHWSPGVRFSQHWGPLVFEAFQMPLLAVAMLLLAFIWRETHSRYAALGALAFGLWVISHGVHGAGLLSGDEDQFTVNYFILGVEVVALSVLAVAVAVPDARGGSFAQRYEQDAVAIARRLQQQVEDLSAAKAALEERERLARELHDSIAQGLFSIKMNAGAAAAALGRDPGRARERLERLQEIANATHRELRTLIEELRPPALAEVGLAAALQAYGASLKALWGLEVRVVVAEEGRLPPDEENEVYRVAFEALTNAAKHGQADRAEVELWIKPPHFRLRVHDNGLGFDPEAAVKGGTFGLRGMKERAGLLGAQLSVSSRPGEGTTVELQRPGMEVS